VLELVIVSVASVWVSGPSIGSGELFVNFMVTGPTTVTLCAADDSFVNSIVAFPGFAKKEVRRNLGAPLGSAFN
jgi:hypothetical protein